MEDSTRLAVDRTLLAYDRTLMAWLRTAISLISFGFTLYKFFQFLGESEGYKSVHHLLGPREFSLILIGLGNFALISATVEYMWSRRTLCREYHLRQVSLIAVFATLSALFGVAVLIATFLRL